MRRAQLQWTFAALLLSAAGCDPEAEVLPPQPTATSAAPAPPAPLPAGSMPPRAEPAPEPERIKAEVGVGKRGRGYGGGVVTEPIRAKFRTEQRIVFDVQIPHAMQLFKATNDRLPRSHDEFMKQIIEANLIALPELPEGERYVYDPQRGELMVEVPGEAAP